jgi:hypothetical protein
VSVSNAEFTDPPKNSPLLATELFVGERFKSSSNGTVVLCRGGGQRFEIEFKIQITFKNPSLSQRAPVKFPPLKKLRSD